MCYYGNNYFYVSKFLKLFPQYLSVLVKFVSFKITNYLQSEHLENLNFVFAPCVSNIKHFIVQLMHTNYKILRLLK